MQLTRQAPHPAAPREHTNTLSWLACALAAALLAAPPAALARTHKGKAHASSAAAAAPSSAYSGRFASECDMMADGLFTQDIVEMRPLGPDRVVARYHKALYVQADCPPSARLGTLHLPVATWQLHGSFKIGKSTAHRITMTMPEGILTATVDLADKFKQTDQHWVMTIDGAQVPIEKTSPAIDEKDLRLLEGDVLYFGDPSSPDAHHYPQEPLRNNPMKRVKAE